MQKRKRTTILITEVGIATATCWWDQLTVSGDSVVLTAVPEVAPPVVLRVAGASSKKEVQRVFRTISKAVEYSARVDARKLVSPDPAEDLG